jgi:hypothetical protein
MKCCISYGPQLRSVDSVSDVAIGCALIMVTILVFLVPHTGVIRRLKDIK